MESPSNDIRAHVRPPTALQPVIDRAVAHAWGEGPEPAEIELLYEWLNVDGWDALIADLGDEMALQIDYLARLYFDDGELRAMLGKADDEPVTNDERVAYTRERIDSIVAGDGDDSFYSSVHAYPLTDRAGRVAILGCTVDIHGQAGPVPTWHGFYRSKEAFFQVLVDEGHWLGSDLPAVTDRQILEKWTPH
jgi:hypothetical protein